MDAYHVSVFLVSPLHCETVAVPLLPYLMYYLMYFKGYVGRERYLRR